MAQINKPNEYFNTVLYTGDGSTNHPVTGVGFQPDLVWTKGRSGSYGVSNHKLVDVVRGAGKTIHSNLTDSEFDQSAPTNGSTISFDTDGFTLGSNTNSNASGTTFVAWNWLAGGTGVSNTDGSVTSTVSANTTSGFSIVTYTGTGSAATIGHGLGVAPACIIFKTRNTTSDWFVYHQSTGATNRTKLNTTDASSASTFIDDTAPSSTVFNTEGGGATGTNGNTYVAYCFAEVKGFSKFGSYTGNGSTDGTFVYTGFKPAWVMVKASNGVYHWKMYDTKRDIFNPADKEFSANDSGAEANSTRYIDFLSNGFKLRHTNSNGNGSGVSYIYMAFAENPLVGTNNIPTTAR